MHSIVIFIAIFVVAAHEATGHGHRTGHRQAVKCYNGSRILYEGEVVWKHFTQKHCPFGCMRVYCPASKLNFSKIKKNCLCIIL
jgi:hypothetical protein